jgi:hypothetical protein
LLVLWIAFGDQSSSQILLAEIRRKPRIRE